MDTPDTARPRRKPGRPTKLTPELQAALIEGIRTGITLESAARAAGTKTPTMRRWRINGAKPDAKPELRAFRDAIAGARAEGVKNRVTREPITDGQGREIGTRVTRLLPNGITEVAEQYTHPGHRALRKRLRANRRDGLAAVLGLDSGA